MSGHHSDVSKCYLKHCTNDLCVHSDVPEKLGTFIPTFFCPTFKLLETKSEKAIVM